MSPAEYIVKKFGGHRAVAEICGIGEIQVRRWAYPPERGGAGGQIPSKHQVRLLNAAKDKRIALRPSDFFNTQA